MCGNDDHGCLYTSKCQNFKAAIGRLLLSFLFNLLSEPDYNPFFPVALTLAHLALAAAAIFALAAALNFLFFLADLDFFPALPLYPAHLALAAAAIRARPARDIRCFLRLCEI